MRRWALWLLWMPVWLPARLLLPVIGASLRASERLLCLGLRLMGACERERFLAGLPPDERERLARVCRGARVADAEPGAAADGGG